MKTTETAELDRLKAINAELLEALEDVASWHQRAEHEGQQRAPVLRDYLAHAGNTARAAIRRARGEEQPQP